MKRILTICLLVSVLVGCGPDVKRFWDGVSAVSNASVSGTTVIVAMKSFNIAQDIGAEYLGQRICTPASRPICREPAATPVIKGAMLSGRTARNALGQQLRSICAMEFAQGAECAKGIPAASYNTLIAVTTTLQDATTAYRAATNR